MKKLYSLVVATLLLSTLSLNAQNLSESLGAIKTNFKFFSSAIDLEVTTQFIVKNAGAYHNVGTWSEGAWGYGAGYESLRLEFVSSKPLFVVQDGRNTHFYIVDFYDGNIKLATRKYNSNSLSTFTNPDAPNSPYFYSLDLFDTPISLLDRTSLINIVVEKGR